MLGIVKYINRENNYAYLQPAVTEERTSDLAFTIERCTNYTWENMTKGSVVRYNEKIYNGQRAYADNVYLAVTEQDILDKNITRLFHFTKMENLKSILEHGLVDRDSLDEGRIRGVINDENRYEHCRNAICLSISFPNYKMFYSLSVNNQQEWVVLELSPKILYEKECAYTWWNAADRRSFPADKKTGKEFFYKLFEDREDPVVNRREEQGLDSCYPTNPQAEVLVFESIPTDYIENACFFNQESLDLFSDQHSEIDCEKLIVNRDWFSSREIFLNSL